jgi:hypothetical protein
MIRLFTIPFILFSFVSLAQAQPSDADYIRCRDQLSDKAAEHVLKTVSNGFDYCQASGSIQSVTGDIVIVDTYVQCHNAGSRMLQVTGKIRIPWWSSAYECKVMSFKSRN